MTTAIDAFGLTDVGRKRKHNEDAYALDVNEGLFIVADGMGGHAAGEVAAKITVETIGEFIAATRQKEEATWPLDGTTTPAVGATLMNVKVRAPAPRPRFPTVSEERDVMVYELALTRPIVPGTV